MRNAIDAACAADVTPYTFTFGRHSQTKHWEDRLLSLDDMRELFAHREFRDDKDGECYMPASYVDNKRSKNACESVSALVFDVDGQPFAEIDKALDAWNHTAFLYSTHSHGGTRTALPVHVYEQWAKKAKASNTPTFATVVECLESLGKGYLRQYGCVFKDTQAFRGQDANAGHVYYVQHAPVDKLRIVVPLLSPILCAELGRSNPEVEREFAAIYRGLSHALGIKHDPACEDLARLFYMPSSPAIHKDRPDCYLSREYDGELLDWQTVERRYPEERPKSAGSRGRNPDLVAVDRDGVTVNVTQWRKKIGADFDMEALIEAVLSDEILGTRDKGGWTITCPFEERHSQPGGEGTFAANADGDFPWNIYCQHASCQSAGASREDHIAKWIADGKLTAADLGVEAYALPLHNFHVPMGEIDAALEQFNERWSIIPVGGKARYSARDADGVLVHYDKTNFMNLHEACTYDVLVDGKQERKAFASRWLHWSGRRQYSGFGFYPSGKAPPGYFNLWSGFAVEPKAGDWSLLKGHIRDNLCRGDPAYFEWFICWLAQLFQEPENKLGTAVVLTGKEGVGKSKLGEWISAAFGKSAKTFDKEAHLIGQFNVHFETLLFALCEEVFWAGNRQAEGVIKSFVTSQTMTYERKGLDLYDGPNYTRLMITSNNPWVVPAWSGGRRWFVLEVGDAREQDAEYFAAIDQQMRSGGLAAMLHELLARPITVNLRKVPITPWLVEQRIASADPQRLWLREIIANGGFSFDHWDEVERRYVRKFWALNVDKQTPVPKDELRDSAHEAFSKPGRPLQGKTLSDWLTKELGDLFNVDGKRATIIVDGKKDRPRTYGFASLRELEAHWLAKYGEDLSAGAESESTESSVGENGGLEESHTDQRVP